MTFTCPSCRAPTEENARFCSECGAALTGRCPACGEEVSPTARFCSACGTDLRTQPEVVAISEERRTITALFSDLVAFTTHAEKADPEDTRRRLTVYHERVRQEVERFGGRVEKLMGDGVFAVFGFPVAHEDDPERAVRAALRLQQAILELNSHDPNLSLSVRVGVTTGEAVVQLDDTLDREGVVGDVVNTASRLQTVAGPGEVVVDDRTYHSARNAIEFVALDPIALKGKEAPVSLWKATGAKSRYGVAVDEDPSSLFVGRSEELSLLTDAFDRAVARRRVQLVTVVGEPGVGKSRLVREFRRIIDDRPDLIWWRQGRCLPFGEGITFWAISEVVKAQAGILESEPLEVVAAKLREAVLNLIEDPEEAEWIRLRLESLAGLGAAVAERSELFKAWQRFFEALAARNPLVLLIEDLHWADDAVIDFLNHLIDWAQDSPILILCTARPELFTTRPQWGGGKRDATTLSIGPLSPAETAELMSALSKRPLMDAELQAALIERSGGNPLYISEFVRLAGEGGLIDDLRRGRELPLPDNVAAIIGARLDLLAPSERALLQAAAVIGRVFWAGALVVIEGLNAPDVQNSLQQLVGRDLIRPVRRPSMQGQEEFAFTHVLARDAAYNRLTRSDRARLHLATARWLEAVSGERMGDVAELLAHHHVTAFKLEPGADPERRRQVYRFLMLAAERSRGLDAARAGEFYRSAIELATPGSARARALLELGRLTLTSSEESLHMMEEAKAEFAEASDREGEAEAAATLSTHLWYIGQASAADRIEEEALAHIEGLPPSATVSRVLVSAAASRALRGRDHEAFDLVERTLQVAQTVGDTASYARALVVRGTSKTNLGDRAGVDDLLAGLQIQLDINDSMRAMQTYNNLATYYIRSGGLVQGKKAIEEAIAYGIQRGQIAHTEWSRSTRIEALLPMGEMEDVLTEASELARKDAARGGSQVGVFARFWISTVALLRGEITEGLRSAEESLSEARDIEDPQVLMPSLAHAVNRNELAGHADRARDLVKELIAASADHPHYLSEYIDWFAQSLRRLGLHSELAQLISIAQVSHRAGEARVGLARAALAEADGRHGDASDLLRKVISLADDMGDVLLGTRARIDGARNALVAEAKAAGESWLDEAEAAARKMKAKLWLDEIAALRADPAPAASG